MREAGVAFVVDLAIPCREGTVAITLGERPGPEDGLRFGSSALLQGDLERIVAAVGRLGGMVRQSG